MCVCVCVCVCVRVRVRACVRAYVCVCVLQFILQYVSPFTNLCRLEGVLALGILALAAKGSCEVLSVLQVAAYGVEKLDKVTSMASLLGEKMHSSRHYGHSWVKTEDAVVKGDVNILGHQMAFKEEDQSSVTASSSYLMDEDEVPPASHSCKNSASAASGSPPRHGDGSEGGRDSRMVSKSASPSGKDNGKGGEACAAKKHVVLGLNEDLMSSIRDMSSTHKLNEYSKSASRSLPSKYTVSSMQSQYAVSEGPLEDGTTFLGSIAPSTVFNRSPSSTPNTLKDMMFDEDSDAQLCHAFFDYPWELAVAFCCNCTSLVTHGRLSKVQEQALQGCPLPVFGGQDKQSRPVLPRRSRRVFGLSQLTHYQGMRSVDGGTYVCTYLRMYAHVCTCMWQTPVCMCLFVCLFYMHCLCMCCIVAYTVQSGPMVVLLYCMCVL